MSAQYYIPLEISYNQNNILIFHYCKHWLLAFRQERNAVCLTPIMAKGEDMKKTFVLLLAIGVSCGAAQNVTAKSADAGLVVHIHLSSDKNVGGAGIIGSSHDLSNVGNLPGSIASNKFVGTGDNQNRVCVYCHHPHNAYAASGNAMYNHDGKMTTGSAEYSPLWNHSMSQTSFVGYSNGIMMGGGDTNDTSDQRHMLNAAEVGDGTKIAGVSLLCMSCHDGVVAMNAYSQITGSLANMGNPSEGTPITQSTAAFKGDMNNHHPMGFSYQAVQNVDAEIAATDTIMVAESNLTINDLLFGSEKTMECVTCHDVHNTSNQTGAERFLWRSNDKSNFCLTCHLK